MTAVETFVELPRSLPTVFLYAKRAALLALFLGIMNLGKDIELILEKKPTFQPDTFSLPAKLPLRDMGAAILSPDNFASAKAGGHRCRSCVQEGFP
jgi:hypothetical protein